MERDTAKRRLHESRVWNKMFYLDMVHIGVVPKPPFDDEDTKRLRKESKNSTSDGAGGARAGGAGTGGAGAGGAGVGGARPAVPRIIGYTYITFMKLSCKERDKVKFATATLQGRALTWWNGRIASMGIDAANGTPWTENGGAEREGKLSKGEGDSSGRSDNRRDYNRCQNQIRANVEHDQCLHTNGQRDCPKCKNKKHAGDCWKCGKVTNERLHKLKRNGQGGNNRGAVYKLGAVDAQQDPKVVTGTFLLNNRYATALFDSGADKSFVSTNFSTLIDIEPFELDTSYEVELADGNSKLIMCYYGCTTMHRSKYKFLD
ncbi:putative reverse transcriptase domain-containing protein [Tanacetum coccineum]